MAHLFVAIAMRRANRTGAPRRAVTGAARLRRKAPAGAVPALETALGNRASGTSADAGFPRTAIARPGWHDANGKRQDGVGEDGGTVGKPRSPVRMDAEAKG